MELQNKRLGGFRPIYHTLLRQEETLESIVPDALPDITRIIEAAGTVLFRQKETVDGSVRVMGTVCTSVLYMPEGEGGPCCLSLNIPFLCSGDSPAIQGGCQVQVNARVISADAQMLNPRKVLARVELAVEVCVYAEETAEVCIQADHGDDGSIQTLKETYKDLVAVDVAEKNFTFSDVLRLSASRSPMEQLLRSKAELNCAEAKVIGKKLVVKGECVLSVLYRSGTEAVCTRFELPFSQILEVKAGGEESSVWTDAVLIGMDCTPRGEEELEVSFEVLLQAVIRQEREVELLADLYSVAQPMEVERGKVSLYPLVEQGSRRQIARQFCQSAIPAKQVVECRLTVGEVTQVPSGEGISMVTAKAYADVLYLSEDDALCAVSYTVPASCELPVSPGGKCLVRCLLVGEPSATPVTGGLEVRFEAEFIYLITQEQEAYFVSAARPGPAEENQCERPSVVIRMVGEGERLWDIAKCCASTVDNIQAVNAIGSGDAPSGTLLLIPKCR